MYITGKLDKNIYKYKKILYKREEKSYNLNRNRKERGSLR